MEHPIRQVLGVKRTWERGASAAVSSGKKSQAIKNSITGCGPLNVLGCWMGRLTKMTSGATYWGVPQMVCIWLSFIFFASPKSAIFTLGMSFSCAGRCNSRFSSFKSRCVILLQVTIKADTSAKPSVTNASIYKTISLQLTPLNSTKLMEKLEVKCVCMRYIDPAT